MVGFGGSKVRYQLNSRWQLAVRILPEEQTRTRLDVDATRNYVATHRLSTGDRMNYEYMPIVIVDDK